MALYKGKYGESGKEMIITLFLEDGLDNSPLEPYDVVAVIMFIEHNWDSVEPKTLPF